MDGTVDMAAEPVNDFDSWYASLDNVAEEAMRADPAVAHKMRLPYIADGKLIDNACEDKNGNCSFWAEIGECQKNPA